MNKLKILGILISAILVVMLIYSCAQQEISQTTTTTATTLTTTTSTTSTTQGPSAGYKIYSGADASGQKFSFEYPEGWTTSLESLTLSWNEGDWIMLLGPGDWETGIPVLSLWIVPKGGTLTDEASYDAAAYADRAVSPAEGNGIGLISEFSTSETVAGSSARGRRIISRTVFPIAYTATVGTAEVDGMMEGDLATAEVEWRVFRKGDYLYDLNFSAVADKVSSREAFLHAKNTFKFD